MGPNTGRPTDAGASAFRGQASYLFINSSRRQSSGDFVGVLLFFPLEFVFDLLSGAS